MSSTSSPADLVRQQRQLLLTYWNAKAKYDSSTTEAGERYKRAVEAADTRRTQRTVNADEHLAAIKSIWDRAHAGLQSRNHPKLLLLLNPDRYSASLTKTYNPSTALASATSAIDGLQSLPTASKGNPHTGAILAFIITLVPSVFILAPMLDVPSIGHLMQDPEHYSISEPVLFFRDMMVVFLPPLLTAAVVYMTSNRNRASQQHRRWCSAIGETYAGAKSWSEREKRDAQQEVTAQRTKASEVQSSEVNAASHTYRQSLFGEDSIGGLINSLRTNGRALSDWWSITMQGFLDPATAPRTSRLGSAMIALGESKLVDQEFGVDISLTAFMLPTEDRSLSLYHVESTAYLSRYLYRLMSGSLVQLLGQLSPSRVELTLIDPTGLGQSFAEVLALGDLDPRSISGRVWSEPSHIDEQLVNLTDHIETIIQKYLRNEFRSIEEYNDQMSDVAEPYRVLAVADFPVNFSEDAIRRLTSIMQQGPRCGVHSILLVGPDPTPPHGTSLQPIFLESLRMVGVDSQFSLSSPAYADLHFDPVAPLPTSAIAQIVEFYARHADAGRRVEVPFSRIAPPAEHWWSLNDHARSSLEIPLGPSGARSIQELALGKATSQHALIVGRTGSGKSTLFHTIIVNAALHYSPVDLELYLVDFKKGVEFKPYAVNALPHARVVAIESEREFGFSVLQALDAELGRRGDLFRSADVDQLADYRSKVESAEHGVPRILVLIDEFQEFFTIDDTLASQTAQILDRLVRQGRAFGIHVVLGSQSLAGSYMLARSTIDQMGVRIALMCSDADSRLILADDNPMARLLSRPGEAIYNDANGRIEGNSQFQVAWLTDQERDDYLRAVRNRADATEQTRWRRPLVFEGNANGDVSDNRQLGLALHGSLQSERPIAWLGEPVAIRESIGFTPMQQSGSNLLIVGQRELEALAMLLVGSVSLAATSPHSSSRPSPRFMLLNFAIADSETNDTIDQFANTMPFDVTLVRRRQLADTLAEVAGIVSERLEAERSHEGAIYLLAFGLQWARDLRDADSFTYGGIDETPSENSGALFLRILQNGPDVGVHTIAWCNSLVNLTRISPRITNEFGSRVVFQSSAEDSGSLIDSTAASTLGPYRAYFYDEDRGVLEKFRPYSLPADEWFWASAGALAAHMP